MLSGPSRVLLVPASGTVVAAGCSGRSRRDWASSEKESKTYFPGLDRNRTRSSGRIERGGRTEDVRFCRADYSQAVSGSFWKRRYASFVVPRCESLEAIMDWKVKVLQIFLACGATPDVVRIVGVGQSSVPSAVSNCSLRRRVDAYEVV